ncbi:hypothetical protein [Streptomyces sp. S186]|uniref:hypothetical protein n=1 Tax=Streptomyces sp. S186 TaxID=3434395 RepID=UPI003F67CCD2
MDPMDVPTEVTKLVYSAPRTEARSQNEVAELLAHYWPAIANHVRRQVLREAAAIGRELSRKGYSAEEIAKKLDGMADGGAW